MIVRSREYPPSLAIATGSQHYNLRVGVMLMALSPPGKTLNSFGVTQGSMGAWR